MAHGISLHIGLNAVDPTHYGGWDGPLVACEADAEDMQLLADSRGFITETLLTKSATRNAVINKITAAAKKLKVDDFFFLTYSGHGGQLPDLDGDETDALDETWCLFDGQLVDDELHHLWAGFEAGVRILVLSDSCHSGTVTKMRLIGKAIDVSTLPSYRAMPDAVASRTYLQNKKVYDPILKKPSPDPATFLATVRLISGCQDNQLSEDGAFNGKFTGMLKKVWNGGKFRGSHQDFVTAIVRLMPSRQTPNHYVIGASNPIFNKQTPFTL